ncbi:hypothetical protein AB0B69_08215 [Micromonospora parva]|uniref:hypothetical protein n=1 Tax=Micromonospora parva TaxID=1464048 RepID=UPI0033E6EF03
MSTTGRGTVVTTALRQRSALPARTAPFVQEIVLTEADGPASPGFRQRTRRTIRR